MIVCIYIYTYSFQESVARFLGDSRTFKRIKNITLTFYFPTGIEHFHCEEKRKKNEILIVVMMSNSTHTSQDRVEKKFQEGFDNFKE